MPKAGYRKYPNIYALLTRLETEISQLKQRVMSLEVTRENERKWRDQDSGLRTVNRKIPHYKMRGQLTGDANVMRMPETVKKWHDSRNRRNISNGTHF